MKNLLTALLLALSVSVQALAENPMDKMVALQAKKTSTAKALDLLSQKSGLNIKIDEKELSKCGITKNQTFDMDAKVLTAKQALMTILLKGDQKCRLAYFIEEDGTVVVTTIYAAEKRKNVRYYNPQMS